MAENYTTASAAGCSAVEETKHQTKICKYKVCHHYRYSDCCFDMKLLQSYKDISIFLVVFNQALTV